MQQGGKTLNQLNGTLPKVSVICVTYNAAGTLPTMLKSYGQYKSADTELIIIDGNSTDDTIAVIKANEALIDFWISEPDEGIYEAMNKAVQYANGQWLIFIGSDDELAAGFAGMVATLTDTNTVYYGNVIYYGREFCKVYDDYYLTKLNICHQGIFYPRTVFQKYQYDTKYRVYADYHLNLRLWKDPAFKFNHQDYLIASFPEGGFSTTTKDLVFESERDQLFKKYLKPASYYRYLNRTLGFGKMLLKLITNG
ncbi:MAG: glycosyltransferase family 2 protein [Mucilaginibacter sp.]